jgi:hypothetical protein
VVEHLKHLTTVMQKLQQEKLLINMRNSSFMKIELIYLGFVISANELRMDPDKVEVIKNWPSPRKTDAARARKHVRSQDLSFSQPEELKCSSISLLGNLHPQNFPHDPLSALGGSDFVTSRGQWSSIVPSSPRDPTTVNADLSFYFRTFLIAISPLAISNNSLHRLPTPDMPKPRSTRELTVQRYLLLHHHFRVRKIANPNAYVSGPLTMKPR